MKKLSLAAGVFVFLLVITFSDVASAQAWWDPDWNYRREVTVTENSGNTLTDYQVSILLNPSNFNYNKANSDGSDIRFTDANNNLLSHYTENWNPNGKSEIIVKVPNVPAGLMIPIVMYYGNPSAQSTSTSTTFLFYDDFNDGDINDWSIVAGSWIVEDGKLKGSSTGSGNLRQHIFSPETFDDILLTYDYNLISYKYCGLYKFQSSNIAGYGVCTGNPSDQGIYKFPGGWISYGLPEPPFNTWRRDKAAIYSNSHKARSWDLSVDEPSNWMAVASDSTYTNGNIGFMVFRDAGPAVVYFDNVKVRKYAEPEPTISLGAEESQNTFNPNSFGISGGILKSGDVEDLYKSDDSKLKVDFGGLFICSKDSAFVEFYGKAFVVPREELEFNLESSASESVNQQVELFNYETQSYEQMDSRRISREDNLTRIVVTSNPQRFVDPQTKKVKARVIYGMIISEVTSWNARFDQAFWKIT